MNECIPSIIMYVGAITFYLFWVFCFVTMIIAAWAWIGCKTGRITNEKLKEWGRSEKVFDLMHKSKVVFFSMLGYNILMIMILCLVMN